MKIQMPLEVWVGVFAPISRYQLADRLNEIGSRQFADIAMFFLHEYGKIKLRPLYFGNDDYYNEEMAKTEMPANIKDFQLIEICAQEDQNDLSLMTTFFTYLQPILSNVNLWCNYDPNKYDWYDDDINEVPEFLNELLPSINSFNSIHFFDDQCFDLIQEKCADKFLATKVISINYKIMKENREWLTFPNIKYWEWTKALKKIKKRCEEIENKEMEDEEIVAEIVEEIIEEIEDEEAKDEEIEDEEMEEEEIKDEGIEDEDMEDEEARDEEIEEKEIKVKENSEQKYDRIVWKPKMAILRKWLLSNGNDADDNGISGNDDGNEDANIVDEPRILYVDKIPSEMFRNEIESISKEFMQSTKPTRFIARFEPDYMDEEQRRNFEMIRLINQTTNEQLSAKCVAIEKKDILWGNSKHWFAVLHSHPIVPDGQEHEENMLLIEKMQEKMPQHKDNMGKKFVYTTNRHINLYRKGRHYGDYYQYGWRRNRDLVGEDSDEEEESAEGEKKEKEEEESASAESGKEKNEEELTKSKGSFDANENDEEKKNKKKEEEEVPMADDD